MVACLIDASGAKSTARDAAGHSPKDLARWTDLVRGTYLEGQGELVCMLITPITFVVTLNILTTNLLTKSP